MTQAEGLTERLAEAERVRDALFQDAYEADQLLGKALGYPEYDETVMKEPDGSVCTGDHVLVTLAAEAAGRITSLAAQLAAVVGKATIVCDGWVSCVFCNGYWPVEVSFQHEDGCPLSDLPAAGRALLEKLERVEALVGELQRDGKAPGGARYTEGWNVGVLWSADKLRAALSPEEQGDGEAS